MALPDLTGQQIQDTYQRVLQTDGSILYDGTGSIINTLPITASHALTASYAVSASHEIIKEVSSSFADTASYVTPLNQDVTITGNVDVSGSGRFTDVLTVQNIQITTGSNNTNTGVGYQALQENIGVDSNGFGYQALFSNQEDGSNGFGYQALYNNRGSYSNGFGYLALYNNTGVSATGFGDEALHNNTGDDACGFGAGALLNNTGGSSNGFGHLSLRNNKGDDASGFGTYSLLNNSGSYNTAIGNHTAYESGYLTGNNNTFLGYNASYGENTTIENSTAVGANITLTDSNTVILGSGSNVGIGTTNPSKELEVVGDIAITGFPSVSASLATIGGGSGFPFTGTAQISGSLDITGSFNVSESIVGESDSIKTWTIDIANSLSVSGQDGNPTGVWFDPTGSRMYMCGYATNDIFEYSLTTPWDVTTATYTGKQFDFVSTNGGTTEGMYISPDGVECYAIGRGSDRISRYRFSTPWDVSTLSHSQSLNIGSTESNPQAVHFKYDGTIMYFFGLTQDTIYQVPLTTPWDIDVSNQGTITSQLIVDLSSDITSAQGMSLSQDGTTMFLIGYTSERITKFTLSTPYDVRTATKVEQSPYYAYIASTPTNIYWNETYNKAYIVGRSSDRIFQLKTDTSVEITKPLLSSNSLTVDGDFNTFNTGRFLFRNPGDFGNNTSFRSTFSTYSTTRLNYSTGGTTYVGNTTYGNLIFQFARNNYYPNSLTTTGAQFDIIRNQFGGKGLLNIGLPGLTNESYYDGTRGIGGTTHITSDADTFDHFGSFTLGGELQVSGSSREVFLAKQEDLYSTLTPIVRDTFTEASDTNLDAHTPETGSGYTEVYTDAVNKLPVVGGQGYISPSATEGSDGYIYRNDTNPSIADYEVRATIREQHTGDDPFWLFVRYVDNNNFYAVSFGNSTTYTRIWKKVGGTSTQLGQLNYYVNTSGNDNINVEVAVRIIGDKIHIFYEGDYRGTWIDSDISSIGNAALGFGAVQQNANTGYDIGTDWKISDFRVTEFPSSVFTPDDSVHYIKDGSVGIGTSTPDASAILDITSTTKGVVFPRMTSAQRTAISSPTTGLIVYQTDATEGLYIYKSTGWVQVI